MTSQPSQVSAPSEEKGETVQGRSKDLVKNI